MSFRNYLAVALFCTVALNIYLRDKLLPSQVSLDRYQSDDVYDGEWNLQRDQIQAFPGS